MKFFNLLAIGLGALGATIPIDAEDADFGDLVLDIEDILENAAHGVSPASSLEGRAAHDWDGRPKCYSGTDDWMHIAHFNTAIARLNQHPRNIYVKAYTCYRPVCEKSAGIAICNYNSYGITRHTRDIFDFYVRIAEYRDMCVAWGSQLAGVQKAKSNWSVLAVRMDCNGPPTWNWKDWPKQP